jgi:hypothetical protein
MSRGHDGRSARRRIRLARAAPLALALALGAPRLAPAQDIVRSEAVDLAGLEIQVTVVGALPSDRVQCLLRDSSGQVRVAGAQPVGAGTAAGAATVLSIPLSRLAPTEREFAVSLVRADRELDRTAWRPVPSRP